MTGPPVLGELLGGAHRELDGPVAWPETAAVGRDIEEVTGSLLRFIVVASRYVGDVSIAFGETFHRDKQTRKVWVPATTEVMASLSGAAAVLGSERAAGWPPQPRAVSGLSRRLDAAADLLVAGRDLMQTHFTQQPHGRLPRSDWAPVIASPAVSQALLAEVATLAGRAAVLAGAVEEAHGSATAAVAAHRLGVASQWLARADAVARAAGRRMPVATADRELLYAVPGSAPPGRRLPGGGASVNELCEAIIATAERARRAAWAAAGVGRGSPAISVTSWRRIATSGAAASRHCHLLLAAISVRAAEHGDPKISEQLALAAQGARITSGVWLLSARRLDAVTTDVRGRVSRAAADAADLALLTGRLAYASHEWSLSSGPGEPTRPAAGLAPDAGDIPGVLAAIHYAADGFARLAEANYEQVRSAVRAGRVLVPVQPPDAGLGSPDRYVPAPTDRIRAVLLASSGARSASARTADAAGDIAVEVRAPSRILAAARVATGARRRTKARRAEVEPQAADWAVPEVGAARPTAPAAGGSLGLAGPFETRLHDIGVTSPRFLGRAAALDRSGQEIITEAATERLDRREPPVPSAKPPGAEGIDRPRPAAGGRRAAAERQRAVAAEPEFEAEP